MGKQRAPLEFNRLAGGIITEASPLTFPDNASIDEVNFELRNNGSRNRRLGFDFEEGHALFPTGQFYVDGSPEVSNSFLWKNVSGRPDIEYVVIQLGPKVFFYKADTDTMSTTAIGYTFSVNGASYSNEVFSFASIDGTLVVATGGQEIVIITVDLADEFYPVFTQSAQRLTIRDLFGFPIYYNKSVETGSSTPEMIDLTDPINYGKRPLATGLPQSEDILNLAYASSTLTKTPESGNMFDPPGSLYATNYSPSTYKGFTINSVYAYKGISKIQIYFDGGVPAFETISMYFTGIGAGKTMRRSSYNNRVYDASITSAQYNTLYADNTLNFTATDTATGSVYNYNLRNQTFAQKRLPKTGTTREDTITSFISASGKFPSMSDTVLSSLYPNVEDPDNKTTDRFHAEDLKNNPLGNSPAPKGYFIIDALTRSTSRYDRWEFLLDEEGISDVELEVCPFDETPGGATVVTEYGGRLWYGGFSEKGNVTENGGTRLESFLLYSQLANNKKVLTRCYQKGDPTSQDEPELLETDGGFISLDGAYGINKLVPLGNSLLVFAENGVWSITGNDGNYFTPTSPRVQKITDKGSISSRAIVVIDTSVMYWTKGGIHLIAFSQAGTYEVSSLTESTIQTLYDDIPYFDKRMAVGAYDEVNNLVIWTYYNTPSRTRPTELLILKSTTGAFTKYVIEDGGPYTTLLGFAEVPPFVSASAEEDVTVEGITVTVNGEDVIIDGGVFEERKFNTKGIIVHSDDGSNNLTFGEFNNEQYLDWGVTDASAYMVMGYVSGGDLQRHKQVPYVTFHFERTEDGFEFIEGDLVPTHPSGCLAQAQWDWTNSANSGRWSREFQAYRYRRHYIPADVNDPYDTGYSTIVTRNKIRGKGRVLSIKVGSEEGKDCRILGWSAIMGVQDSV
jgi:hypothetical protein